MENVLKKLCIENINKNKENYIYSYDLEKPLNSNENQIKAIFENPKFKRIVLHFDFYRLRLDLTIYSKDQYTIDIYLNEKQFFNFYKFIEKELKKNYEHKSNLKLDNVFVLSSNKYQLVYE